MRRGPITKRIKWDRVRRGLYWSLMLSMSVVPAKLAAQRSAQLAACRSRRQSLSDALADIQRRQRNIGLSALVIDLVIVVLANAWGIGSNSGEMGGVLLTRLAAIRMGWPEPPPVK